MKAKYIAQARALYGCEDVNIDDDAKISEGDDGAFVQAWVWVSEDDMNQAEETV